MKEPFLLTFDPDPRAVLEPDHEQEINNFHFQPKLLFAFLTPAVISDFLARYPHKSLDSLTASKEKLQFMRLI